MIAHWLNGITMEVLTWFWNWFNPLSYWICACGILVCTLAYILCRSKKSIELSVKFALALLLINIVRVACL